MRSGGGEGEATQSQYRGSDDDRRYRYPSLGASHPFSFYTFSEERFPPAPFNRTERTLRRAHDGTKVGRSGG